MKITILQLDTAWMNAAENIRRAESLINAAPDADLYILPEMWATGFSTVPDLPADEQSLIALQWMRSTAQQHNCAIAGTLAIRVWPETDIPSTPALWRNRFFFVMPNGKEAFYDKRNLFAPGGEDLTYTAGRERTIVSFRGIRFMLQTCFDLRFPETARNFTDHPYDVLLYAANWPEPRIEAWLALLRARAIENQALCIGINRTGTDSACIYNGRSAAFDAYGTCLAAAGEAQEVLAISTDMVRQSRLREKFSVLRHSDFS